MISQLLAFDDADQENVVEVRLTPRGDRVKIKAPAAGRQDFIQWVMGKLDVQSMRDPQPYTRVAGLLGLEQRETLIVMAAASVGAPDRFKLCAYPEGIPLDLAPTHIMYEMVQVVKSKGLEHGLWPLLSCSAA